MVLCLLAMRLFRKRSGEMVDELLMGSIRVKNLGKAYKQYPTRWSRLAEWVIPFSPARHALHWVLSDLSFDVEPGEALGIIGVNGAGKSTLLKMITGTTLPLPQCCYRRPRGCSA